MSQLLVDDIVNKDDSGSPGFSKGAVVTGIVTATTVKSNTIAAGVGGTVTISTGVGTSRWHYTTAGHLIPLDNAAYDIGNAEKKVRHLFLSDNSLKFVDDSNNPRNLSVTAGGNLKFDGGFEAANATFAGNVSVGGTLTYEDVQNIDSVGLITARNGLQVLSGITTLTGQLKVNDDAAFAGTYVTVTSALDSRQLRVASVAEQMIRVSAAGSVGICTYNGGGSGNVLYFDAPNGDAVIKLTGVPTDSTFDNQSIVVSAILRTTGTGRSVHPYLNINGVDRSIKFSGGSRNEATSGVTTTNGYTIYNFIGINTIGSAASTASYEVLGCVSGGFF